MQKIKTVRYTARNIGGDRCFSKLRYVIGTSFSPTVASPYLVTKFPFNVGAFPAGNAKSISGIFGQTPNLSTLAQFYQRYRIRGIKLRFTIYYSQVGMEDPAMCFFVTAQSSAGPTNAPDPVPNFPAPAINITPEQRWTRSTVISNTGLGAKPTTLSVYYSVNKVFGPDAVVKNDADFIGDLDTVAPYWSSSSSDGDRPQQGPWLMYGIYPLDQTKTIAPTILLTYKVEATVYAEMFGKRPSVQ